MRSTAEEIIEKHGRVELEVLEILAKNFPIYDSRSHKIFCNKDDFSKFKNGNLDIECLVVSVPTPKVAEIHSMYPFGKNPFK